MLTINESPNDSIKGFTLSSNKNFRGTAKIKGEYDSITKQLILEETGLEYSWSQNGAMCLMFMVLSYSHKGNREKFTGRYSSTFVGDKRECGTGSITLSRKFRPDDKMKF